MAQARRAPQPLAERLVDIAHEVLESEGAEQLSLREIARRAGVSHTAPLRHFRGLSDLLSEVAARGFRAFSEAIERSGSELPPGAGPIARTRAGCRAYVEFAVEHPQLFGLMFRPELLDRDNPNYRREAVAAFEPVVRQVRAAQDAGWHPQQNTWVLAGAVWAALHGLAILWSQKALTGPVPHSSLDDALTAMLELLMGPGEESPPDEEPVPVRKLRSRRRGANRLRSERRRPRS